MSLKFGKYFLPSRKQYELLIFFTRLSRGISNENGWMDYSGNLKKKLLHIHK